MQANIIEGITIERFEPKDRSSLRLAVNNIYVKNFSPDMTEEDLKALFSKHGDITSMTRAVMKDKDGVEKPLAFICYHKEGDLTYGPTCALNAVTDLHEKEIDGFKIYVQPALSKLQRLAQVEQDSLRFKMSKKKCNLFVRNIPHTMSKEAVE